jgi:hypothetical protein
MPGWWWNFQMVGLGEVVQIEDQQEGNIWLISKLINVEQDLPFALVID